MGLNIARMPAWDDRSHGEQLGKLVKHAVGVTVAVDVVEPGILERSAGKAQRVVDMRVPE